MKRAFGMICCGILMLSGALFWASASNASDNEMAGSSKLTDTIIYEGYENLERSTVDPLSALTEQFGAELANEIMSAGPNDLIMLDFVNGGVEVSVVPGSSDYPAVESTEPFVPEGLEVAGPLITGEPLSRGDFTYKMKSPQ